MGSFEQVVLDRMLSVSFIAALPEGERQSVAGRLRALPARFAALREPVIAFPYVTQAWLAERLS